MTSKSAYRGAHGLDRKHGRLSGTSRSTAHGAPLRATVTFDGKVSFTIGNEQPQRESSTKQQRSQADFDKSCTLEHNPSGTDAKSDTIATGLRRRLFKLDRGLNVKAKDDDGEWYETQDGAGANALYHGAKRSEIEAAMQRVDIPRNTQKRVLRVVDSVNGSAWSFAGGAMAAVAVILLRFDDKRGLKLIEKELHQEIRRWAEMKNIERRDDAIRSFVSKLQSHFDSRLNYWNGPSRAYAV